MLVLLVGRSGSYVMTSNSFLFEHGPRSRSWPRVHASPTLIGLPAGTSMMNILASHNKLCLNNISPFGFHFGRANNRLCRVVISPPRRVSFAARMVTRPSNSHHKHAQIAGSRDHIITFHTLQTIQQMRDLNLAQYE